MSIVKHHRRTSWNTGHVLFIFLEVGKAIGTASFLLRPLFLTCRTAVWLGRRNWELYSVYNGFAYLFWKIYTVCFDYIHSFPPTMTLRFSPILLSTQLYVCALSSKNMGFHLVVQLLMSMCLPWSVLTILRSPMRPNKKLSPLKKIDFPCFSSY